MTKAPLRPWFSGFCTGPHADWQHAACHGGHTRTPTKADPRDWVPCACPLHTAIPEEPPMPEPAIDADDPKGPHFTPSPAMSTGPETTPVAEIDELTLDQAVTLFAAAADRLSEACHRDLMATSWVDAIRLLDQLRTAGRTAGQVDATLVRHIYLTGEHGRQEIDGVGVVGIARTRDRKDWDERGVARAVIDAKMADTTGEAPDPWQVAEWLLEVYGVNYCRVTPLRALGLDPKMFCEETPGKPAVQLPPRS